MTFLRFVDKNSPQEMKGLYMDGKVIRIHGSFFGQFTVTEEEFLLEDIRLLPPVLPQTICCVGQNSYIKSASSLFGGGELKVKHGSLLCTPRVGVVVREKGPSAFGSCLMLDFAPEEGSLVATSSDGYTVVNAIHKGIGGIACTFNGLNLGISAQELVAAMKDVASYITLTAGDIVALPLADAIPCKKGDKLSFKAEPKFVVTLT